FLAALRFFTRIPVSTGEPFEENLPKAAARFGPLVGVLVGAAGGSVYWLGAKLWPTSVAVVLSMFATTLIAGNIDEDAFAKEPVPCINHNARADTFRMMSSVFALLIKYNVLMAL